MFAKGLLYSFVVPMYRPVEEAREAGIEEMIFVTGRGKTAIVEHFDMAYELETTMSDRGKDLSVLDPTRFTPGEIITVRQQVPLGLGHAIWCARAIVGSEPFAILLPDELMVAAKGGGTGCLKQMVEADEEDKAGFVEATLALALEREDMGAEVRAIAERLHREPAPI